MKHLLRNCTVAAIMAMPLAAFAQNATAPNHEASKAAQNPAIACPMMGDMAAMHKDMEAMKSDLETMSKDAKDAGQKEKLEGMRKRMATMMVSMQKMSTMHSMMGMMGGMSPTAKAPEAPDNVAPAESGSTEDHKAHHPAQ